MFVSDLVGNSKDRFSYDAAQVLQNKDNKKFIKKVVRFISVYLDIINNIVYMNVLFC